MTLFQEFGFFKIYILERKNEKLFKLHPKISVTKSKLKHNAFTVHCLKF